MCKKYNGYKNYTTWAASLWLGSVRGDYLFRVEEMDNLAMNHELSIAEIADWWKLWFENVYLPKEVCELMDSPSFFADAFGATLEDIDWHNIIQDWMEDVNERNPEWASKKKREQAELEATQNLVSVR